MLVSLLSQWRDPPTVPRQLPSDITHVKERSPAGEKAAAPRHDRSGRELRRIPTPACLPTPLPAPVIPLDRGHNRRQILVRFQGS
jgi:hypothetical protein